MSAQREYVFFTDRDLGKQFPDILRKAGVNVEKHIDHFADDAKDEEWLRGISERGWYALTHNKRIRYVPNEKAAVERFGVGLFVVVGEAPLAQLAQNFVLTLAKVVRFIEKNPPPFIAKVYRPNQARRERNPQAAGDVRMWVSFRTATNRPTS